MSKINTRVTTHTHTHTSYCCGSSQQTLYRSLALSFRALLPRTGKLEDVLRALLLKHTADMATAETTSRKLAKMADLFQQLQAQDDGEGASASVAPAHGPALSVLNSSAGSKR